MVSEEVKVRRLDRKICRNCYARNPSDAEKCRKCGSKNLRKKEKEITLA